MSKFFKNVKPADTLYFVVSSEEGVFLYEGVVDTIKIERESIAFKTDYMDFNISPEDYVNEDRLILDVVDDEKNLGSVVFVDENTAESVYNSIVEDRDDVNQYTEEEDGTYDNEDGGLKYTKEELDNMSYSEILKAVNDMSPREALYHAMEMFGNVFGIDVDGNVVLDNEVEESDDSDDAPDYYVPSSDEIRDLERPVNFNENGGLNSVPAVLMITINEDGINALDPEHFNGVNPVFNGPKVYFHSVLIPDFDSNATEDDVDEVYKATEEWIYENYPELEALQYAEDWRYDFLRGTDYTVDTDNVVNFNIFE